MRNEQSSHETIEVPTGGGHQLEVGDLFQHDGKYWKVTNADGPGVHGRRIHEDELTSERRRTIKSLD